MNSNGRNRTSNNGFQPKAEINIAELIQIVRRKKLTIFISMFSTIMVILLHIYLDSSIYEATVTLKKEAINNRGRSDEFKQMFSMQTMDELDTELEIIKTRTVLESLIDELDLLVEIHYIEFSNGRIIDLGKRPYINEVQNQEISNGKYPKFSNFDIDIINPKIAKSYCINVSKSNGFELYEEKTNGLLQSSPRGQIAKFNLNGLKFDFNWPLANNGDKVYFKIKNIEPVVNSLQNEIEISKVGKTNVFTVSFQSTSPVNAQLIANTVVEKYRQNRLAQKRQSTHSSFEFVDSQLQDISEKLKNTELELGQFKSKNKITNMAESSREILRSLSELESEKLKVDLELGEYQNKLSEIKKEQSKNGYIDQTYLTPDGSNTSRSPFSVLLEQLSDAEIRRLELIQKRRINHPDVITINGQISQIKSRLAEYNKNTMTSYQILINALIKKQYSLYNLIEKTSSRLEYLPSQETALIELMRNKNAYEKMYTLLLDKREELRMAEFSELQDIIIVDAARIPLKPVPPRKTLKIAFGIFLGLIIGIISIIIQEFFDKRISGIEDIETKYPFTILTILPKYDQKLKTRINAAQDYENRLVVLMDDQLALRESYRLLRTKLPYFFGNGMNVVMFTSCEENTGKTTVVANYAMTLARAGKKVLIIDCDLRKSSMAKFLKLLPDSPGLAQYLSNELETPVIYRPFVLEKSTTQIINFIPAGGCVENSSELLESKKMGSLITKLHSRYDFILIDTAPITRIVDTLVLGQYAKNVIMIVRPDHTYKDSLATGIEEIKQANLNLLGFVINACNLSQTSDKYKYGYGYGYGYGHGSGKVAINAGVDS